jgi:hypothetical protein
VVLRHELAVLRLWGVSSVLPVKRMFCEVRLNLRTPQDVHRFEAIEAGLRISEND